MKTRAVLISVAGLVLAGCSPQASATGTWRATEPADAYLEIVDDGTLSGSDGCNRLFGDWEKDGSTITFGAIGMTEMYCEGVDDWLSQMHTATVTDATMTIFNEAGSNIGELKR
ncbi:META domain-containing protein [Corynebacterium glutamicum]|uniref:META domain-containing protein n=1 Tax=Corynebacterium glutamicum TaxID=1718 RepID=UPI000942E9A5|nr:META domain-containing protein [Corynebacterium glutamicum]OKX83621.1 META domain-containing protein [Corynebacterium glutamicum]